MKIKFAASIIGLVDQARRLCEEMDARAAIAKAAP